MTWWTRLCDWLACRDPDEVESTFPDGTQPIPQDMHAPGPDTHKMMIQRFPPPSDWDALERRRGERRSMSGRPMIPPVPSGPPSIELARQVMRDHRSVLMALQKGQS